MKGNDRYILFAERLKTLEAAGRLRRLPRAGRPDGPYLLRDGRRLLNLSSNDYLGYASDTAHAQAFYPAAMGEGELERWGLGSAASRLMAGNHAGCERLESRIAAAYGPGKAALLVNSGYHANIGAIPALAGPGDLILSDRLNHASIIDGIRLSGARWRRYRHLDYGHLRDLLRKTRARYGRALIVTESIFSMDGDRADLDALVRLRDAFDALLYVDEAHAVGVCGEQGLGCCCESGAIAKVDVVVGTFGKALGSFGAYLVMEPVLKSYCLNHMRSFVFSTALPPAVVNWSLHNFERMQSDAAARSHLDTLSARLRESLLAAGCRTAGTSQIVPVLIGGDADAVAVADRMEAHGFLALAVRPPTVPEGTARLRLSICANMTWADLAPIPEVLKGGRRLSGSV